MDGGRTKKILLAGDWNGNFGLKQDDAEKLGQYGYGARNRNGQLLMDFAVEQNLWVLNTCFKKRMGRRWTWKLAGARNPTKVMIDMFLSEDRGWIRDVRAMVMGFSDHKLVLAILEIMAKVRRTRRVNNIMVGDRRKLRLVLANKRQDLYRIDDFEALVDEQKVIYNECAISKEVSAKFGPVTIEWMRISYAKRILYNEGGIGEEEMKSIDRTTRKMIENDLRWWKLEVIGRAIRNGRLRAGRSEKSVVKSIGIRLHKEGGGSTSTSAEAVGTIVDHFRRLYEDLYCGPILTEDPSIVIDQVSVEEVKETIMKPKGGWNVGVDGTRAMVIKEIARMSPDLIARILNRMLVAKLLDERMATSSLVLILNKGDVMDINNHRPISMATTMYKILSRIARRRVETQKEGKLKPDQAAFRRGYSAANHLVTLNLLYQKTHEFKMNLVVTFVNFMKAFDSLKRIMIWEALQSYGVDGSTIEMVKCMYGVGSTVVRIGSAEGHFKTWKGIKQGDTLSPLLFVLTVQYAMEKLDWSGYGLRIGHTWISKLCYADDIVLVAKDMVEMQRMLDGVTEECAKIGLVINKQKTMWMGEVDGALQVNGEAIQKTSWYKYLGQHCEMPRRTDIEVQKRIQAAWAAFRAEYDLLTSRKTEAMTYGAESWALRLADKWKLERCQRRMERAMLGLTLRDEVRSRQIRARTKLKDVVEAAITLKWKMAAKIARAGNERWTGMC
ncbi:unnamed protein product [Bursaphelenchus okinawaensis]|uniref:Reverse transcriptase domain-containing protein n=1 Tax=Bursaphelenchus okinawaensis TaxID=465554 RepID=A0A811KYA2_9BILA|nr:unnamed protein product [Bursaphelenchus okinawaensis]CAG9113816.1 unnamed protein product [Bursaphelenchus okinawaensis]